MEVAALILARTGTVLISRPTIDSAPGTSAGRPETTEPKTTSCCPVSEVSSSAHAPCNTVLTVVCCARANSPNAPASRPDNWCVRTPRRPNPDFCGGPTRVGV
ncbi:Uncharacterised protein [Mycobacteroides abscessus subsp. abscessus]|nr:Uncharacterised protein [Mycobacteroides abscessus subsp. abscessus]